MNGIHVIIFRWLLGMLFMLQATRNISRFPIPSLLSLVLAMLIIPHSEKLFYKNVKLNINKWMKLVVIGVVFFLFNLSLPKPDPAKVAENSDASPVATASAVPSNPDSSPGSTPVSTISAQFYDVDRVVDGDTVRVLIDGISQPVRVVGVNTPEVVDPRQAPQCFGQEASAHAKQLLSGMKVSLEPDATQPDRDKYGRLLRFVFLEDGSDFGLQMIRGGYAQEVLYSTTPHKYRAAYVDAEAKAKIEKVGLWADGICVTLPVPTPSPSSKPN
jgi:micrococcal nuclease